MSNRTELHDKIQQITAKIIDLNADFASRPSINQLGTDLLKKYTVELYDAILQLSNGPHENTSQPEVLPPVPKIIVPVPTPPAPQTEPEKIPHVEPTPPKIEAVIPKVEPIVVPPPPVAVEEKPIAPQPVEEVKPVAIETPVAEIPMPPSAVEIPVPPVAPPIVPPAPPVAEKPVAEKIVEQPKEEPSLNDRLQIPDEGKDIASKMQQTPIHDLKKAISINKKFEFINQLFKGDHEAYAKSIHYINGLTNGNEAVTFFNNLRKQFNWDEENKLYIELAEMVRRRFM